MAIRINGSHVDWLRYEFAVLVPDDPGEALYAETGYANALAHADATRGRVMMRAVYATGWSETLENPYD